MGRLEMKIYLECPLLNMKKDQSLHEIEFDRGRVTLKDLLYRLSETAEMACLDQNEKIARYLDISINGKYCVGVDTELKDGDTVQIRLEMLGGG